MTYYAARLSFNKSSQTSITQEVSKEPPLILAERLLITGPEPSAAPRIRRHVKGRIDFYIGNFLTEGSRLIAFKIGKKKIRPRGTYSKKIFQEINEDHYPANTVIWSAERQIILIEKPKKDQMSVRSIINSLQDYLNGLLLVYGYAVSIELLTHKSTFWEVIEKYEKIYNIEFTLFAPNFLDFSKSVRELLKGLDEDYNANETSMKLSNKGGNLKIRKDDNMVTKFLEWITNGAGRWSATVESDGKKIPVSSESGSKVLNKDLSSYDVETAKEFSKKAKDLEDEP